MNDENTKIKKEDISLYAECATLAYKDYPLFNYVTNGKYDHQVVKTIISSSISAMQKEAIVFANEDKSAVALFAKPNYKGCKAVPFLIGGGIKLLFMTPLSTLTRLINYENHSMKLKKNYTNHSSWYLYNVTVKPQFQNQGNCSKLLKPMFNYLDKTKEACYLETHNENNVKLYEHFGFELLEVSNIPKTNIKHYVMIRKPKNIDLDK